MSDDIMGEGAPQRAQRLHSDNLVTHQRLGDVVGAVDRLAVEVRGSAEALSRRTAVDEAWVTLWTRVIEHPTVQRVALAVVVLVAVRLLLPEQAAQAVAVWMVRILGIGDG